MFDAGEEAGRAGRVGSAMEVLLAKLRPPNRGRKERRGRPKSILATAERVDELVWQEVVRERTALGQTSLGRAQRAVATELGYHPDHVRKLLRIAAQSLAEEMAERAGELQREEW